MGRWPKGGPKWAKRNQADKSEQTLQDSVDMANLANHSPNMSKDDAIISDQNEWAKKALGEMKKEGESILDNQSEDIKQDQPTDLTQYKYYRLCRVSDGTLQLVTLITPMQGEVVEHNLPGIVIGKFNQKILKDVYK